MPRDKAFALVESGSRGIVIVAVNRAAWMKGVRVGQALSDARAILPELLTRPGEALRDEAALERLALWLGRYGPSRNKEGEDGLWVDITGVAHLFGGEAGLARDCVDRLARVGFTARLGIGDTRSGASALARYGCGRGRATVIATPGEMREALQGLPVEGLGLGNGVVVLLGRLGLRRIGQLYNLPRAALARRFREGARRAGQGRRAGRSQPPSRMIAVSQASGWAQSLVMRLDQALGTLSEPAPSLAEPPHFRAQRSFTEPLISHAGIVAGLDVLAQELCERLVGRAMGARRFAFQVYRADGGVARLVVRVSRPTNAPGHIEELFAPRLERIDAGLGVDALVLEAFDGEVVKCEQTTLRDGDAFYVGGAERLGVLADRLINRFGASAVYRLAPVDRHIPELAQACRPVLDEIFPGDDGVRRPRALRPLFLIDPPERIEVIADVPDGPPARFTWRRISRRVARAEGPERIAPEWWRRGEVWGANSPETAGGDGTVVVSPAKWRTRDYYRIEDEQGARYWVYRAGLYGAGSAAAGAGRGEGDVGGAGSFLVGQAGPPQWFLQGVF